MSTESPIPPSRWFLVSGLVVLLIAGWFYQWAPSSFPARWLVRDANSTYHELTAALLAGQLHLERAPDPRLVALPDPYDPAKNAAYRINDLSYYRGHYYFYQGIAPVLVLLAPVKLLTGYFLTNTATTYIFCLGGLVLNLLLLLELWSRAARRASLLIVTCCALSLAFANGYPFVLRSNLSNLVSIASAYFFLSLSLWSVVRALAPQSRAWRWLALAATSYGLAIASRPNYLLGALALLIPVALRGRQEHGSPAGYPWKEFFAVTLPIVTIIGGLLTYNFLRFGNPLEFGLHYLLGGWDQRALGNFGLKSVATNAWHYLLAPADYHAEFPFATPPSWQALGVLLQFPFVWLAVSWAGGSRAPIHGGGPSPLRLLAAVVLVVFVANLGTLILLPSGNNQAVLTSANSRYEFDFLPALVLLASCGLLAVSHAWAERRGWRRRLEVGALGLTTVSLLTALSLDFARFPSESYRPLAELLNRPTRFYQWLRHEEFGPIELTVRFPTDRAGGYEPLVATGTEEQSDLVYVHYIDQHSLSFGAVGTGVSGPLSAPITLDYSQPHKLEIHLGSLYPGPGHPRLSGFSDRQVAFLKRDLSVAVDGVRVFATSSHFYPSSPREVCLGVTPFLLTACDPRFTGTILSARRLPIDAPDPTALPSAEYGPLRFKVRFPTRPPAWAREPLVVTGVARAGDFIFVTYPDQQHIQVGYDHWGEGGDVGPPVRVDFSEDHELEISLGSLYPPIEHRLLAALSAGVQQHLKQDLFVKLDGQLLISASREVYESSPFDVFVGKNIIGGSSCSSSFTGTIGPIERLPWPAQ